ncbi:MAG TPA: phenylalanine--tRNA ligase subunit alpha [Nitrososphaerales archaeon]|nr:phenylalanine--tRNA ligase subunit alpha [Nitrososphaerales archaeon]
MTPDDVRSETATPVPPLHPIERTFLLSLGEISGTEQWVEIQEVSKRSGLALDQVRRAVEWLREKGLILVREKEALYYSLGPEGLAALESGLPERKIVNYLEKHGGSAEFSSVVKQLGGEFSIALGNAKKNRWIAVEEHAESKKTHDIKAKTKRLIVLLPSAREKEHEELILEKLGKLGRVASGNLTKDEIGIISILGKRVKGLIVSEHEKSVEVVLSEKGKSISSSLSLAQREQRGQKQAQEIDAITSEVLRTRSWKTRNIRPIDVTSPAPPVYAGRKHPMRTFMDEVREAFVSLGFEEILGPIVHSTLWNFDALFIPQRHSAREMQDTFYIGGLRADTSRFAQDAIAIKDAHETGGNTGSRGWQYAWSEEESRRVVLRTHTTAVTISYLARYKPEEARVFTVGKVYRNEKPTYKNNPEFSQIEGVMVGKDLNLRNLIYIITQFYSKLGFHKIKFWPTFFPYTEPSLQTMVYYEPTRKWMELGGMGIFRPEVTLPLGVNYPVLAWGLGMDRLVMMRYGVTDVRELFGANLGWLRQLKIG